MTFKFGHVIAWSENTRFRDSLSSFFNSRGVSFSQVRMEKELIDLIKNNEYSLVLAMFHAVSSESIELIQKIKNENKNRLLVFAKNSDVEFAVSCIKHGSDDFLIMPEKDSDMIEICKKVLEYEFSKNITTQNKTDTKRAIITDDSRMKSMLALSEKIASSKAPVFLSGESGTGKEIMARFIHEKSGRKGPFIGINCAALPENLLESSLFGHEKGAFTGAVTRKPGKFELADQGTLLLDEITEMSVYLQAKLLRVLQEGEVDILGGIKPLNVDVRIIAATNKDPLECVREGNFRSDLFHRINTIPIKIPSLKERINDIPKLADHFIEKYNAIDSRDVKGLTEDAKKKLLKLTYSGNIRELENIIRRAILISDNEMIKPEDIITSEDLGSMEENKHQTLEHSSPFAPKPLREVEKEIIFKTLAETDGNRTHAAELLGISVRTLRNKLNSYKSGFNLP